MSLEKIREEYLELVKEVKDEKELYDLRVKFLGKKGALTDIMKGARDLSPEERPSFGKLEKSGTSKSSIRIKIS